MTKSHSPKIFISFLNHKLKKDIRPTTVSRPNDRDEDWQEHLFSPLKESRADEIKINQWRLVPLFIVLVFSFLILGAKSWRLQMIEGQKNKLLSEGNRIKIKTLTGARGKIYDRNKIILARNGPGLRVVLTPIEVENEERVAKLLSIILKEKENEILETIKNGKKENAFEEIVIKTNIDHETQLEILARQKELKGVAITKDIIRDYPEGLLFSAVIGYTGEISQEELERPEYALYLSGDLIGRLGIENSYENELKENKGKELVEVDALGNEIRMLAKEDPRPGNSLVLALNYKLQKKAAEYLEEGIQKYKATGGAVIIQKPDTGEVLSLISMPTYDNNLFAKGISADQLSLLVNNPLKPLFNRAVSATYPSGSTIKPLVASAALQEHIISRDTKIMDNGSINVGSYVFPCWTQSWGYSPHGLVNVEEAIAQSCDVFFYTIGGGYGNQPGLGMEKMKEYALKFGLSEKSGIDIPNESSGFYPDPAWKLKEVDEPWYLGDTYWVSIGQSYVLVTTLQINNMINVFANGGKLMKPYLVKDILDKDEKVVFSYHPEIIRQDFISSDNLAIVKEGMRRGANGGIIYPFSGAKVTVAAKTGTAEYGQKDSQGFYRTHAWVTGFAPFENPQLTFTVFLEDGSKSNNAAEVARKIIDWYFTEGLNGS